MPRYFFDIRDEEGVQFDETGLDLPDIEAARAEARRALSEMMRESILGSGKSVIQIDIRTDDGTSVVEVVAAADDRDRT